MDRAQQLVAITGGAGRVGRLVASILKDNHCNIRILDLPTADYTGLDEDDSLKLFPGDIGDEQYLAESLLGCDVVVHLAAVLPPIADENPALTRKVNVDGTTNVINVMSDKAPFARLVFGSSVVVYGNTQNRSVPVRVDTPLNGVGAYAESKIECERIIADSGVQNTILRISGVSVAEFLMPPVPWPFTESQRMEFVLVDDVAAAVAQATLNKRAVGTIYNVAGGDTWRMVGRQYSDEYYALLQIPVDEAEFITESRAFDYFDTERTALDLDFVPTEFSGFKDLVERSIQELMGEVD